MHFNWKQITRPIDHRMIKSVYSVWLAIVGNLVVSKHSKQEITKRKWIDHDEMWRRALVYNRDTPYKITHHHLPKCCVQSIVSQHFFSSLRLIEILACSKIDDYNQEETHVDPVRNGFGAVCVSQNQFKLHNVHIFFYSCPFLSVSYHKIFFGVSLFSLSKYVRQLLDAYRSLNNFARDCENKRNDRTRIYLVWHASFYTF